MPVYEVTSPDGKVFEVTAPEGATQEQVLAYAKAQFETKPENGVMGKIKDMLLSSQGAPITGGPLGMLATQGMKKVDELVTKGAYKAGGAVTDLAAGNVSPEVAAGLGLATNVAAQAAPSILAGQVAKMVASPAMKAGGRALMQSAAKPTIENLRTGKAARAVETLLKEGVNPTKGGVEQLRGMAADITPKIEKAIAGSTARIDKGAVADRLRENLARATESVNPQADMRAVEAAWSEFMAHPLLAGKQDMPVQLAQKMKQGTYASLGNKPYGELQGAATEAQKALARGLKEEISKAVPAVAPLNARQSDLFNALNVAERRALMDANKNPMGLALLAHNPASLAAFLADKSAAFKGLVARMLYSGSDAVPFAVGAAGGGALASQSGKPPKGALSGY